MSGAYDTLGWVLGALTVGLGALYFFEEAQSDALRAAESHATKYESSCDAHAAGPGGKTLLLSCTQRGTPTHVPAFFEFVVVRVGSSQSRCAVLQGRVGTCEALPDLP